MKIIRFVSDVFSSNVYVLEDRNSNNIWLIDAGYSNSLIQYVNNGKSVKRIFLTHIHFDHINGLNKLIEAFPKVIFFVQTASVAYLRNPNENLSMFHDRPMFYLGEDITLKEGDIEPLNENEQIKVFETPGHHPTCLTYQVGNYLFTGDSYIPGLKVVTNLPKGNKELAQQTVVRIKSFWVLILCCVQVME